MKKPITKDQQKADLICLRKLKFTQFINIYQVIQKTAVLKADTKKITPRWGTETLAMEVIHENGNFSFPIYGVFTEEKQNVELRRIFFNILGLHKQYVAPVAPYPPFKLINNPKTFSFIKRLKAA